MKYETYLGLEFTEDFSVVKFTSIGSNGPIAKRISFTTTDLENVYNLSFGDIGKDGETNDFTVSNNGDRNKILATVFRVVGDYTERYPNRWVYILGSTKERTRLYRMAIGGNLDELSQMFDIYAYSNEEWSLFTKNMEIESFLIKRKNV